MGRMKRTNLIAVIAVAVMSVWMVGEITFKIYEFNSVYKVRSYAEKLD